MLDKTSVYWAHRSLALLVEAKFAYMVDDVRAFQAASENNSLELLREWEQRYHSAADEPALSAAFQQNAHGAAARCWELFDALLFKYADGWRNTPARLGEALGYPAWWLREVGYGNGPPPPAGQFAALPPKLSGVERE